jgi:cell fate regulator YaaT (PSP1 superfamily)
MKVVKIKFHQIDKEYFFLPQFTETEQENFYIGQQVIVQTTLGKDMGTITDWVDWQPSEDKNDKTNGDNNSLQQNKEEDIKAMLRPASEDDFDQIKRQIKRYPVYFKNFHELLNKHNLNEMRLIDVMESFDGARLTFYFIADARVDFRELVKDLVKKFHKKIRLQQIGVRDAAKITGDLGPCGLPLCCRAWLRVIGNVSPDYIKDQELMHRGADRLTGVCGRLKCCLRYEEEVYKYHLEHLPKVGDIIKTKAGDGKVKAVHALKHTVDLEIDGNRVEYPYFEGSKCEKECNNKNKPETL